MKLLEGSSVRNFLQGFIVYKLYTKLMKAGELGPSSNKTGGDQLVRKAMLDTPRNKTNTPYYVISTVAL